MGGSLPTHVQLLWPTLEAMRRMGGSATIQEIFDKVVELERFSEDQLKALHGDGPQTEIAYRLAWARTYLKAVGAIENSSRGVWAITDEGRGMTRADVAQVPNRVRAHLRSRGKRDDRGPIPVGGEPPVEDGEWKSRLLDVLVRLQPDQFERLCQRLLREEGFISVEVTGRSGDRGIDGVGVLRLSLLSFPVFFQAKRYRGSVGPEVVRAFRGAMAGRGDKGLLITTGTFTREAEREGTREGTVPIDLIDGGRLCELLKKHGLGLATRQVEQITIDEQWYSHL